MAGTNKRPTSKQSYAKRRRKKKKADAYLTVAVMLLIVTIAISVVIACIVIGDNNKTEPADASVDSSSLPADESVKDESKSSESTTHESEPDESMADESSVPADNSADESEGGIKQLASTVEYENSIGKKYIYDMTKYEQYIDPEDDEQFIFLVNASNPLDKNYVPADLVECTHMRSGRPPAWRKINRVANEALKAFLAEAEYYGFDDITVTNAYRPYESQATLFSNYVANDLKSDFVCDSCGEYIDITYEKEKYDNGKCATCKVALRKPTREETEAHVVTYSTRPGTSEHQSGLCLDMHNHTEATNAFNDTPEAKWLAENAHRFGYILRYPPNTQHITGIKHESWHFRFVGRDLATYLYKNNLTLDEYINGR